RNQFSHSLHCPLDAANLRRLAGLFTRHGRGLRFAGLGPLRRYVHAPRDLVRGCLRHVGRVGPLMLVEGQGECPCGALGCRDHNVPPARSLRPERECRGA
ncbi:MAG: hypothetical protein ACK559_15155, partial [bacterium]